MAISPYLNTKHTTSADLGNFRNHVDLHNLQNI